MSSDNSARAVLEMLWERHSQVYCGGQLGMSGLGKDFWCNACRTPWPCADAKILMKYGQYPAIPDADWLPLTLVRTDPGAAA